jgi:hypothetical protein
VWHEYVSKGIQNTPLIIPTAGKPSLHFSSILPATRYALQTSAWGTENKMDVTFVEDVTSRSDQRLDMLL